MTTPDTPAKKVVAIEILYLDETGYGPEGKHTRREWRAECLEYFEKGAEAFWAWQQSWQAKAAQNKSRANFGVVRTFDDGSRGQVFGSEMQRHCLDFAGHTFEKYVDIQGYQFLNRVLFFATIFTDKANFSETTFTSNAYFDETTFAGGANFGGTTFTGKADFRKTTFTGKADFSETTFTGNATFNETTFKDYAAFIETTFKGDAYFGKTTFKGDAYFDETTFTDRADFSKTTFKGCTNFSKTTFKGYADFSKTTFKSYAVFNETTFKGYAVFNETTFKGYANFSSVSFQNSANFFKSKFEHKCLFQSVNFKGMVDFENAKFENLGHFEEARFDAPTSKIPSFRGVDLGGTSSLEFSDDTYFTKADFGEEAVKNIAFLKHLSEQHGQIDQALNFNAMELRAKYLQVDEQLRRETLHWLEAPFKRVFSGTWWSLRLTWLYGVLSDFGRSYMRPLLAYGAVFFFTWSFALYVAIDHKPKSCPCNHEFFSLECDGKPQKEDEKLYLDGYDAAFNYAMYHATGLIDFTGDSKLKDAINQRLFGEPIKPIWARVFGALLSLINTALLFLIALGLRNNYRLK